MDILTQQNENVNICRECGATVYGSEAERYRESHGLDEHPFEDFMVCPHCNGDLLPAERCEHCGEYETVDSLIAGFCRKCRAEYKANFTVTSGRAYIAATGQERDFGLHTEGTALELKQLQDYIFPQQETDYFEWLAMKLEEEKHGGHH